MKTLDEIYAEILADDQLTATAKTLHTAEEQVAFVKAQGGDATAEEIADFLVKKSNSEGELTDAELEQVAGGKNSTSITYVHTGCGGIIKMMYNDPTCWKCQKCGEQHYAYINFDYYCIYA